MNPGEHARMARAEAHHWWYRALRDVIGRTLSHPDVGLPPNPAILDAGCGTGETLRFLGERFAPRSLAGFDLSDEAVALAAAKAPGADVYPSDLTDPALRTDALDLVVCLDVLSEVGRDAARPGLARLARALVPGGSMLLHLPAYAWLHSEHDVAVGTRERFVLSDAVDLVEALGLVPIRATYRMTLLFPALVASRLGTLGRPPSAAEARSALHDEPSPFVNGALERIVLAENRVVASGGRLPFGSSVFVVARKESA